MQEHALLRGRKFICFYLFIQAVDVQTSRIPLAPSHEAANPCGVPGNDRSFQECDTPGEFQQESHANVVISSAQDDKVHLSCPGFFSFLFPPERKASIYLRVSFSFSGEGFCHLLCC